MKLFAANKESQQDEKVVLQTPTRDFLLDAVDGTWSHNSLFSHYSPASLVSGFTIIVIHA